MTKEEAKKLSAEYGGLLLQNRRWLHAHPELSFKEAQTSSWVRSRLEAAGVPMLGGITGNSVVGYLEGAQSGPSIGFRADMDALGLNEETDLPFKSTVPGVMHACGHDAHTATLVAMAEILAKHRELIRGKVFFVFQQGEEFLPGGAVQLCRDGVMTHIDYIFAWHAAAMLPVGTVALGRGPRAAAVATYDLTIVGKGGHGGSPHKANNPVIPAAELVSAINLIPALRCDPLGTCTTSVSYLHCGTVGVCNVLPATVNMGGNIRSMDTATRDFAMAEVERLAKGICGAHGCTCDINMVCGYPACVNSDVCYDVLADAVAELGLSDPHLPPDLGAEDFAYYGLEKPAGLIMLGMADPSGSREPTPHHNPHFYIDDEDGLPLALTFMLTVYFKALDKLAQ